ncbi:MAG: efflux RND transporter periplasmic adaptor subunit [Candidatus Kapaibacterium sp.]|nr:MAG: efflux RND transporter periplasmic adaptor subunit [Candidatus Kapabacteria bacterium]
MKKRIITLLAVLGVIGVLAVPKLLQQSKISAVQGANPNGGQSSSASNQAASAGKQSGQSTSKPKLPPMTVQGVVVHTENIESNLNVTGSLLAAEEVELRSELSGIVTKLILREGQSVQKGSILLKLNDAELQAQLRKLLSRKKLLEEQEFRQRALLEIKGISQNEYDIALNEVQANKAEIDLAQAQIARTELRAPFSGSIGLRYVSEGAYITPQSRIATLTNVSMLRLDFAIPGQYAPLVRLGDKVSFTLQGTDNRYEARISAIEPRIDPMTRTVQIRALFSNNRTPKLFPGAFAEVAVHLHDIRNALMIPSEALIPEIKGQRVFVAKNKVATPVDVETGIRTERKLQIVSGIQEGDTVITTGLLQIKGGANVNVEVQ